VYIFISTATEEFKIIVIVRYSIVLCFLKLQLSYMSEKADGYTILLQLVYNILGFTSAITNPTINSCMYYVWSGMSMNMDKK